MITGNAKSLIKESRLSIHDKIYLRGLAYAYLTWAQYQQLCALNKIVFAPYYNILMRWQSKIVEDAENFEKQYGITRYEYEQ